MMVQDPVSGRLVVCDAEGPCDACAVAPGPLHLVGNDMLCWRCRLDRQCPAYARARQDNGTRGAVSFGRLTVFTNSWAGETRN